MSAPVAAVLFQLANGRLPGELLVWGHWPLRVNEVRRANPESDISEPPQLNEITKGVDQIMSITPERPKSEGTCLFEFLVQGDKDGRVREGQQRPHSAPNAKDSWCPGAPEARTTAEACLYSRPMRVTTSHNDWRAIHNLANSNVYGRSQFEQGQLI
ncbi:MAG: hypothetical protein ACLP8X_16820 [Streptosporangiaceae bacterium]